MNSVILLHILLIRPHKLILHGDQLAESELAQQVGVWERQAECAKHWHVVLIKSFKSDF